MSGSYVPSSRIIASCLALLAVATAVIHFAVAGSHFQQYWMYGVFMLVVAWLELLWAAAVIVRPSRLVLGAGVILNVGVAAVYIITRTVGDIVGPGAGTPEAAGFGDVLCTVFDVIVAAGCVALLVARADRQIERRHLLTVPAAVGAVTATLLSVALVAGGPEMVMTASASAGTIGTTTANNGSGMAGMNGTSHGTTAAIHLATTSPAGYITMPDANMQMAAGMKMASPVACTATPTASQQQAAVTLVNTSWQDSKKYQSLAAARAAGYIPITPVGAPVVHYLNPAYYRNTVLGGPVLNVAQPQSLVYANTPKGAVLVAAMFITSKHGPTPQPGGCLTQYHVHTNLCLTKSLGVVGAVGHGNSTCPPGSANRVTPPMMHVWFVPIPGGPTAIDAPDQQVVQAAETVPSPANGTA
jgi:hypothetical protein